MIKKLFNITILTLSILAITIASFSYTTYADSSDINVKVVFTKSEYETLIDNEYYSTNIVDSPEFPVFICMGFNYSPDRYSYCINLDTLLTMNGGDFFYRDRNGFNKHFNPDIEEYLYEVCINHHAQFAAYDFNYILPPDNLTVPQNNITSSGSTVPAPIFFEYYMLQSLGYYVSDIVDMSLEGDMVNCFILTKNSPDNILNNQNNSYLHLIRYDYSKRNLYYKDTTTRVSESGLITSYILVNKAFTIYDTNMQVSYSDYDTNNRIYYLVFNSNENNYITFGHVQTVYNDPTVTEVTNNSSILNKNLSIDYTTLLQNINTNSYLINQNTDTIIELLSDLQVTEVNNIYNDIVNNYNIDIDTEINDLIGDLSIDINAVDFDDPKFNISSDGIGKLGVFKTITNSIISVYDNNNISLLYFVPLVLVIVGAIVL